MDMVKGGKKNRVSTLSGEGAGLAQPLTVVLKALVDFALRASGGMEFQILMAGEKEV